MRPAIVRFGGPRNLTRRPHLITRHSSGTASALSSENIIGSKSRARNSAQTFAAHGFEGYPAEVLSSVTFTPQNTPSDYPSNHPHSHPCQRTPFIQKCIDGLPTFTRKPWRDLWAHERFIRACEAAADQPFARTFTLNFSPAREAALQDHAAPDDVLRRSIAKELKALFGRSLPFAFCFDTNDEGRLHAHGIILPGQLGEMQATDAALSQALARSGGKVKGKSGSRQVSIGVLADGLGWAAYALRNRQKVFQQLPVKKLTFVSDELTRIAKSHHEAHRATGSAAQTRWAL